MTEIESPFRMVGTKDSLVDRVVNEIEQSILDGTLHVGTRLPPERDLAEQIGVSRTVIREATHILATKGLLETKHGIGTVVKQMNLGHVVDSLSLMLRMPGISLDHLHQVRSILELENADLAATQATEADIADLKRILAEMEAAVTDPQAFAEWDAAFHTAIAKTAHNPLLTVLLDSIRDLMQNVRVSVSRYPDLFKTVIPDHRRILDRIIARDDVGARQAMQTHLTHARRIQDAFLAQQENETAVARTQSASPDDRKHETGATVERQGSGSSN